MTEWRLLAAPGPGVLGLDLAGVPYWQARSVGVHRIGQLTKPDLLLVLNAVPRGTRQTVLQNEQWCSAA